LSKLILGKIHPSTVGTPPQGYAVLFQSILDDHYYVKLDTGVSEKIIFESDLSGGNANEVNIFDNFTDFPLAGNPNFIYIDRSTNKGYRWNSISSSYVLLFDISSIVYQRNNVSYREAFDGETFNVNSLVDALDQILFPYALPRVIISSNVPGNDQILEKGDSVSNLNIGGTYTKTKEPINSVVILLNNSPYYTIPSPNPNGGTINETFVGPFTNNSIFKISVSDNFNTVHSGEVKLQFVYPYYYGSGLPSLLPSDIQLLTKDISLQSDKEFTFSPNVEVMYFAYPSSYPVLTSIKDNNDLETIDDWVVRIENFNMLDSSVQPYRVYEFKNPTLRNNLRIKFKY
jgi:hypothetical protein